MSNETLFYICGIGLAVSAVLISLIGLRVKGFPGRAFPVVILWFVLLVGGATTFAVLHAQDEEKAKAAETEPAGKKYEEEGSDVEADSEAPAAEGGKAEGAGKAAPTAAVKGPGGTLKLAADPTEIAYVQKTLTSKPGKVTIDFTNPAALEHDVAIEAEDGKEIAASQLIGAGNTSVSADLAPGTYHYYCTVPGHREAGMEGVLTVR